MKNNSMFVEAWATWKPDPQAESFHPFPRLLCAVLPLAAPSLQGLQLPCEFCWACSSWRSYKLHVQPSVEHLGFSLGSNWSVLPLGELSQMKGSNRIEKQIFLFCKSSPTDSIAEVL